MKKTLLTIYLVMLVAISHGQVILYSNTFFDPAVIATYPVDIQNSINATINGVPPTFYMPSNLRNQNLLDAADKARQLQWALRVANQIPLLGDGPEVILNVTGGSYNYKDVYAYTYYFPTNTSEIDYQKAKLFINRNYLSLLGPEIATACIYYNGLGVVDVTDYHAKVLVLINEGLSCINLSRITFSGDNYMLNSTGENFNPDFYKDEYYESNLRMPGLVFVKTDCNDINIDQCSFTNINNIGLSVCDNTSIVVTNSYFYGSIPKIENDTIIDIIQSHDAINNRGFNYNGGIYFNENNFSPNYQARIENCTFSNFIEGIENKMPSSKILNNHFQYIYDHSIYFLHSENECKGHIISGNTFDYNFNDCIKIAGDKTGCRFATIQDNTFNYVGRSEIYIAGQFNKIINNTFKQASSGLYAKELGSEIYPNIYLDTYGGNTGRKVNSDFNYITNNKQLNDINNESANCHIFLNALNIGYSITFNYFSGQFQIVYAPPSKYSSYAPISICKNGSTLVTNQFTYSPKTDSIQKVANLNFSYSFSFNYLGKNYIIVKYQSFDTDYLYLIGEDGTAHVLYNGYKSEILEIADLNGNGIPEIYSKQSGYSYIYGKEVSQFFNAYVSEYDRYNIQQWYFYDGQYDLIAHTINLGPDGKYYFISAFAQSNAIYKSFVPQGGMPLCNGSVIYSQSYPAASTIKRMISGNQQSANAGEEIFIAFENTNNSILRLQFYNSSYTITNVYNNPSSQLGNMIASDLYSTSEDEIYNQFGNKIYCSTNMLGAGTYFYNGSYPLEIIVSADLTGDTKKEIYTKFSGLQTLYYSGIVGGIPKADYGHFYTGNANLLDFTVIKGFNGKIVKDKLLSIFEDNPIIYKNSGLICNGSDYLEEIFFSVFNSKFNPILPCFNPVLPQLIIDEKSKEKKSENLADFVKIYPNPVNDIVTIELSKQAKTKIEIYDQSGVNIIDYSINDNIYKVDCRKFKPGIYYINVVNENGKICEKINIYK